MDMRIYNTLSKQKEEFVPIDSPHVTIYHCGPTVYWTQHIGNLRAMVMADIARRSLTFLDYHVTFVRNYTDVGHLSGDNDGDADTGEDRMEKAAKREESTPLEIAEKYISEFDHDTRKLHILAPTYRPRATEHIAEMQKMISTLLEKGFAYNTPLAVYFDISKASDYTRLSGQDVESLLAGKGHGSVSDPDKRNTADFALWFFKAGTHAHALQTWPSPFESSLVEKGEGFPGWHIECSAMSKKYLGPTIDIHMGGIEHIPIHHTNEIAQSESANDKPYVKYWMHNEHLLVDGKKMSKSEGTSYTLSDITAKKFKPLDLRYFMLQAHYRSKQNFTWDALEASRTAFSRLKKDIVTLAKNVDQPATNSANPATYRTEFTHAISDDFNTPVALSVLHQVLKSGLSAKDKLKLVYEFDDVLGLALENSEDTTIDESSLPQEIKDIMNERAEARKNGNWDLSDSLRDKLQELGYTVSDTVGGQEISRG